LASEIAILHERSGIEVIFITQEEGCQTEPFKKFGIKSRTKASFSHKKNFQAFNFNGTEVEKNM